ncbi:hypothetical protein PMAYCL1PPCAC_03067, partial [Pristionchus mayeri]
CCRISVLLRASRWVRSGLLPSRIVRPPSRHLWCAHPPSVLPPLRSIRIRCRSSLASNAAASVACPIAITDAYGTAAAECAKHSPAARTTTTVESREGRGRSSTTEDTVVEWVTHLTSLTP